jgi:DNA-binding NarL/FixJ family response regulator
VTAPRGLHLTAGPMGKSQRLRTGDVRGVRRLIGECRELWYDSAAWRARMFEGLCELTGAQCGMGGERTGMRIGQNRTIQTVTWQVTPAALKLFEHWLARPDAARLDIAFWRFQQTLTKRIVTADQQQFVTAREWRQSEMYNEYIRPSRFEHRLISCRELPYAGRAAGDSLHQGIVLYRFRGGEPFGRRQLRIVHRFNEQCGPLIGSELSSIAGDPLAELRPRVGQALLLLLAGDGEKQAAARMRISRHTLHGYVKRLHRHFGVTRRRELLVRCRALAARTQPLVDDGESGAARARDLPPRLRQALTQLLRGASEADIAGELRISPHTVHDYVKQLYSEFGVSSRAELFCRCPTLAAG